MVDFYGTAAGFTAYHTARGTDVSAYTDDTEIESALLVASERLDGMTSGMWMGYKVGQRDQTREWPRSGVVDADGYAVSSDTVPDEIDRATYELALRQLASPGALMVDYTPSKYTRVSIEGALSVSYASVSAGDIQTQYPVVWQILSGLIYGSSSGDAITSEARRR